MKTFSAGVAVSALVLAVATARAQSPQEPIDSHTIIRSDSRLVLVDTVVTDKKGGYVHGLAQKDFKVWEDGKEQAITTFSFQADGSGPNANQKHYLVLFFDNSSVSQANQIYARQAATKFIDSNAGPNHMMAIVEFGGSLRLTQNFTDDSDRLKKVVSGVRFASVDPTGATGGTGALGRAFTNYSSRNVLLALKDMAKGLSQVDGRKTLIFLSGGFKLPADNISELTNVIDALNHANVAVYPIDIRGLVGPTVGPLGMLHSPLNAMLNATILATPLAWQGRGGAAGGGGASSSGGGGGAAAGGGGGGGAAGGGGRGGGTAGGSPGGGSAGGSTGGGNIGGGGRTGGATPNPGGTNAGGTRGGPAGIGGGGGAPPVNPAVSARQNNFNRLVPNMGDRAIGGPEEVLYALANGTGGFVIMNTNDLLGGLEKIGKEQNEYYVLGYVPSKELEPGACHTIKVKADKGNARFRTGYCDAKNPDVLSGTPTQRELEARITGSATPTIKATMLTPFFYISPNTARVSVVIDMPGEDVKFAKEKGKFVAKLNVIGLAYLADGGVAARFSDSVKISFEEKKQMETFSGKTFHYEKQFEMASGKYALKVAFSSSAQDFGRLEMPLTIEDWNTDKFFISGLALSKSAHPANAPGTGIESQILEDRVPLVVNGIRIDPAGTNHFLKTENAIVYGEIYEPQYAIPDQKEYTAVGVQMQLIDAKTNKLAKDLGLIRINVPQPGTNPAVPVGLKIPVAELTPGAYWAQITAMDGVGKQSTRAIRFDVE